MAAAFGMLLFDTHAINERVGDFIHFYRTRSHERMQDKTRHQRSRACTITSHV
jgi:hypothetical protein